MKVYRRFSEYRFAHPEDMSLILDYLKSHGEILIDEDIIEDLYYLFSDEKYSAGWLCVDEQILEESEEWLNELDY
jgi:hypothetical protein